MYHQVTQQQNMQSGFESRLQQVAAEIGRGPLYSFLEKLALAIGTSAGVAPQYINSKNQAAQVIAAINTNVQFDTDINVSGISRLAGNEVFQLTQGKTYHLIAHLRGEAFTTAATGRMQVRFVDENDSNIPVGGPDAIPATIIPPTNTTADSADPTAEVIYTVPATVVGSRVKLRVTFLAGGPVTIPSNGATITIVEVK